MAVVILRLAKGFAACLDGTDELIRAASFCTFEITFSPLAQASYLLPLDGDQRRAALDTQTVSTLEAIAGLWKLALVLLSAATLTTVLVMFKDQLRNLITRAKWFEFKAPGSRLSIGTDADRADAPLPENTSLTAVPPETESALPPSAPEGPASQDFLRGMFEASGSGDLAAVDEAYAKLIGSVTEEYERQTLKLVYHYCRFTAGATDALDKLERLAMQPQFSERAITWLRFAYDATGEFDRAAEACDSIADAVESAEIAATYMVERAKYLHQGNSGPTAFASLADEIAKSTDISVSSILFRGLAAVYELSDEKDMRAFALEKAIELRPKDAGLQFNTAYAQAQDSQHSLAMLHYEETLKFRPDNSDARNNVGVAYENVQLPGYSAAAYKRAAQQNHSLSAANLAYQYMNAGFEEEANEVLKDARKQDIPHANVGSASAKLSALQEAESERRKTLLSAARRQQRFVRDFAAAYFAAAPKPISLAGRWAEDESIVAITESEGEFTAAWPNEEHLISGEINNRGARITSYERVYDFGSNSWSHKENGRGYAYLSEDSQTMAIMIHSGSIVSFKTLALAKA